jgi:hypothetical protein
MIFERAIAAFSATVDSTLVQYLTSRYQRRRECSRSAVLFPAPLMQNFLEYLFENEGIK